MHRSFHPRTGTRQSRNARLLSKQSCRSGNPRREVTLHFLFFLVEPAWDHNFLTTYRSCHESFIAASATSKKAKGSTSANSTTSTVIAPALTKAKIYTPGLQNLGNTCFFNSVVQVISLWACCHFFLYLEYRPLNLSLFTKTGPHGNKVIKGHLVRGPGGASKPPNLISGKDRRRTRTPHFDFQDFPRDHVEATRSDGGTTRTVYADY